MNVLVPWLLMVSWLTYQHGIKQDKLPEPYHYLGATGAISIAAIVSMWNKTVGGLLAYGLVIALFVNATGKTPTVPAKSEKLPIKEIAKNTGQSPSGGSVPTPTPGPAPSRPA